LANLSSTGGWVKNNLLNQLFVSFPRKGEEMKRWALLLFAFLNWLWSEAIFSKALANPSG
jgi:hypothetical protein